jgi:hypothetical protein
MEVFSASWETKSRRHSGGSRLQPRLLPPGGAVGSSLWRKDHRAGKNCGVSGAWHVAGSASKRLLNVHRRDLRQVETGRLTVRLPRCSTSLMHKFRLSRGTQEPLRPLRAGRSWKWQPSSLICAAPECGARLPAVNGVPALLQMSTVVATNEDCRIRSACSADPVFGRPDARHVETDFGDEHAAAVARCSEWAGVRAVCSSRRPLSPHLPARAENDVADADKHCALNPPRRAS